jgi:hypothetical protein
LLRRISCIERTSSSEHRLECPNREALSNSASVVRLQGKDDGKSWM